MIGIGRGKFYERVKATQSIGPSVQSAGAVNGAWLDMQGFHELDHLINVETMATSSTLNAKLQEATDGAGAGVKDIAGKVTPELTEAGGDSDKLVILNVRTDDMDKNNGFRFARIVVTTAVADVTYGVIALQSEAAIEPVTQPSNTIVA